MYYVYILRSLKDGKCYIGQTYSVENRLREHNGGRVRSTKSHRPYKIIHIEEFSSRTLAIKREHYLKSPQGWLEVKELKGKA
jgi:putative endonuclease